ncbi:MAG: antitoxin [Gemmatimonadetes bacterium]|nr:antitoxin [Gemmatimonadota bacterium]MYA64975.1 antitoxin [Gemmatimonadota bacterium]MYB99930.1 antitoxin [Gemmatimonadota bacterium]MYH52153.1 antitoxin [Gemmatimonadota bacterium]MYI46279.1 antitoxin [Gemmatimonadota bacterium]
MRTTLKLDPDIHHAVRSIARERGESLGTVVSSLARAALQPRDPATLADGFPVFDVGPDAPPLTPEMVRDALEDV